MQFDGILADAPQLHHLVLGAGGQQTLVTVPEAAGHLDRQDREKHTGIKQKPIFGSSVYVSLSARSTLLFTSYPDVPLFAPCYNGLPAA